MKTSRLKKARALISSKKAKSKPFDSLMITCEHGGNHIPARYKKLCRGQSPLLSTHRGYDIGALNVARALARRADAPLFYSTTSRLLIDLNRSLHHKAVYSEFTRELPDAERAAICVHHYAPYRLNVEAWLRSQIRLGKRVLHVSIHSFTPKLDGEVRNAEIGLLYDPKRKAEAQLAAQLFKLTKPTAKAEGWRIRRNYPYHGASDGFTTHLRQLFEPSRYMGIEIEMNQTVVEGRLGQGQMALLISQALAAALGQ